MPTLRTMYLHELYAGVTEDETNNNTTAAAELPNTRIHEQSRRLGLIDADDATRNASSNNKEPPAVLGGEKMEHQEQSDDHEEGDDYLDTLLQEAIDAVNRRDCSFGTSSHAVQHQPYPHEEMVSSEEEEIDNDPLSSVHLDAIQQTSGNKRKRRAPSKSVDDRLNDLMAFKAKYGHCDVSRTGENASLAKWCSELRGSYKKMQNNQKPRKKLSDEQIQRLNDAGFKWCLQNREFDKRFNDLMAYKAKYGHCNVSQHGEDASLGQWCSELRGSCKKFQNNQKPRKKLSDEQIQRLNDAGFKWRLRRGELTSLKTFDERLNDLMAFKAKYGHCNVSTRAGEDASLGQWCSVLRWSYKKMQNNQKPRTKLSEEQIQRLSDAGFKWCLQKEGQLLTSA